MTGHASERRDEVLGAALRELDVPEHRPRFHDALRAALEREADGRGDVEGEPRRAPPRPPRRRRPQPRRGWAWGLATAAAITAVALVAVMVGLPGPGPGVATAAEVRARVTQAWATAESISGVLAIEGVDQAREARGERPSTFERRWSFLLTAWGDFRLTRIDGPDEIAYDAGTNVERGLNASASIPESDVLFASEITGLAPGPPDPGPSREVLDRGLGSVVRALATSRGGRVREVTYEGREAWLLETDLAAAIELSPDHLRVTVDRETGFPVRVVAFREARRVSETRIEDLRVNPALPEDAFRLEFPEGMDVSRTDYGFRPVPLEDVASVVGYEPLVPAWVPDGYQLSEVMVSEKPTTTGAFSANPAVGDIVSLSYRRGLDQFVVTTRPVGEDPRAWADPLDRGEGRGSEPERVTFTSGALAGRRGELVVDPMTPPHVWAITERSVVTISGDLTRAELLRVAESLEERT
jgi:anti-sigma factor RsiW